MKKIINHLKENWIRHGFETLVVTVGILGAFTLSNWSERKKAEIAEIEIYKEIKDDLFFSYDDIQSGMDSHLIRLKRTIAVRDQIMFKKDYTDSIVYNLLGVDGDDQFFPKTTGFETLKSIGLGTLTSDSLRQHITNLFQLELVRIVKMGREESVGRDFSNLTPFIDKYLVGDDKIIRYIQIPHADSVAVYDRKFTNYNDFIYDEHFLHQLQSAIFDRQYKIVRYNYALNRINALTKEIDKELNRLEN